MRTRPSRLPHLVAVSWLVLWLGPLCAYADEETGARTYGFKAGYWIPGEQLLRDVLGSGVSFGVSLSLPLRSERWIDFEAAYWKGSGDLEPLVDGLVQGAKTYRSSTVTLVPLGLSLRLDVKPVRGARPFLLGGVDLTVVKEEVDITQTKPADSGTNSLSNAFLGFHVGGGAEMSLSSKAIGYLEVRLSVVNADTPDVNGVVGNGVSLGGTGVFAGVRMR